MCGIAGIFHYRDQDRPIDRGLLERMTNSIRHRGPDAEGYFFDGPLGFGHRRLSIVDLSETGRQPMTTPDRRYTIVYNGEFYDHARHRPALNAKGAAFRGHSDTETLLHLIAQKGPSSLKEVRGIFGLAHWDSQLRRLLLARDHLGVKQVYVHDDGKTLLFASEIKALLEAPEVARDVDPEALNQYLHFHTPLFERTFFRDVWQLRAGETLEVSGAGLRARRYWSVEDFSKHHEEAPVTALRGRLDEVVHSQLLSDVPVGSFFSGGIDSTVIAGIAGRYSSTPLQCFGVHFSGDDVIDERPYQEAAARALGTNLELITVDGTNFPEDMQRLLWFQDQPVIGAAMIPMYHVSKLAAAHVKVCLGGQAADEVFGGYARYALARPATVLASAVRNLVRRPQQRMASSDVAAPVGGNLLKQLASIRTLRRLFRHARNIGDWRTLYFDNFATVPERRWLQLIDGDVVSRRRCREIYDATIASSPAVDPAAKVMHWDQQTYLTGLFQQDDRMSMANSLESRVPMADPTLVAWAAGLPFDQKFRDGATKWLLRRAVSDIVPATVLNRRKVGFDTPAQRWMSTTHNEFVHDTLLSSAARSRGLWKPAQIERLLANKNDPYWFDILWKVLCIEIWFSLQARNATQEFTKTAATAPRARAS